MAGLAIGLLVGFALSFNQAAGIVSLGGLTLGVVLVFNAPPEKKPARMLGVSAALLCALTIYWLMWEDLGYLIEVIIEDFQ
jgi:ABC-type nickel/cobalt efflux system permease component RcnA